MVIYVIPRTVVLSQYANHGYLRIPIALVKLEDRGILATELESPCTPT